MLVLTAATVCTARACTKRLDETQWPETRDETYWAETETYCFETKTRPETHRSDIDNSVNEAWIPHLLTDFSVLHPCIEFKSLL